MGKILNVVLLLAVAVFNGCAYAPPVGVDRYAGRQPIGCGTLECKKDLARYHERLARDERRAWERAARNKERIQETYAYRIPYEQFRSCVARCYVRTNAPVEQCATACKQSFEGRNSKQK